MNKRIRHAGNVGEQTVLGRPVGRIRRRGNRLPVFTGVSGTRAPGAFQTGRRNTP